MLNALLLLSIRKTIASVTFEVSRLYGKPGREFKKNDVANYCLSKVC